MRLIGVGRKRPVFVLGDATPGYGGSSEKFLFQFRRFPYEAGKTPTMGSGDTFATALENVDITLQPGNPAAVAVRYDGAQMLRLQDVFIDAGTSLTGIHHNAHLMNRVVVVGGQYNWLAYSAGWGTTVVDCLFEGASTAAVDLYNDAKLTFVRTIFTNTPRAVVVPDRQRTHLFLDNCLFDSVTDTAVLFNDSEAIPADSDTELVRLGNQLTITDSIAVNTATAVHLLPTGRRYGGEGAAYRIDEVTYGLRIENAMTTSEHRRSDPAVITDACTDIGRILRTDIPELPATHSWVNIADFATSIGRTVGDGNDDLEVFQLALASHRTIHVPMGQYLLSGTLRLNQNNNLIGLHPRQTWLMIDDRNPRFADPDQPRAVVETPLDGLNIITGIGIDTARHNPGAASIRWRSRDGSLLADSLTQFVKYHVDGVPEQQRHDPGYAFIGRHKYNYWIDGGGGTLISLWAMAGFADNGLLIDNPRTPGRTYQLSVEHHQYRETVLRNVHDWTFYSLQTENHIYGNNSQAVEITDSTGLRFANLLAFRVATIIGPHPHAVTLANSHDIQIRQTPYGYRDKNQDNTIWKTFVHDHDTGQSVPETEFTLAHKPDLP